MKVANGNDKLGKGCLVVSRPVGDTCPSTCEFLGNGCYAEQTEKMYPNVRPAGMVNLITERGRIRSMILDAMRQGKSIRWHERGDWFLNGELDTEYVDNVTWACESILADGNSLPKLVVLEGERFITCPEIRRGRGVVTCTPTKGSVSCDLCPRGLANVLFPSH